MRPISQTRLDKGCPTGLFPAKSYSQSSRKITSPGTSPPARASIPLRCTVSNRRRQAALPTGRQARRHERASFRQVPSAGTPRIRACLKIERGSCGRGFWLWPRRQGPRIPNAGCKGRANEGHRQKTRRPEGSRVKSTLAALLIAHRPLRVCSLLAPCKIVFSTKTGPL